jgi:purine-cytosine permease-like protein
MQKDTYEKIVNFLLGASWAILLLGAAIIFKFSSFFGLIIAFFATLLYVIVALFLILFLDLYLVQKEKLREMKKQTKLLENLQQKQND